MSAPGPDAASAEPWTDNPAVAVFSVPPPPPAALQSTASDDDFAPPPPPAVTTVAVASVASTQPCAECGQAVPVAEIAAHLTAHWRVTLEREKVAFEAQLQIAHSAAQLAAKSAADAQAREQAAAREFALQRASLEGSLLAAEKNAALSCDRSAASPDSIDVGLSPPTVEPDSTLSPAFFPELEFLLKGEGALPSPAPAEHVYAAASVFLYDSFHCRSIKHATDLASLRSYQFIHISRWKKFVRFIAWAHLMLGFIEQPSSILIDEKRYGLGHPSAGAIELVFLCVHAYNFLQQYRAYGPGLRGFWRSPWRAAKVPILVICVFDVLISMGRDLSTPGIHLSQIFRVYFVLERSSRMRQLCSCVIKSVPATLSILFLCVVQIFIFGVVGYIFIRPLETYSTVLDSNGDVIESRLYFSSLSRSFLSMYLLLTSANFPKCMIPSYRNHWFVSIYFVLFVIVGYYGLLRLTTAVVFQSFELHTKEKLSRALDYRHRALRACFVLLSESASASSRAGRLRDNAGSSAKSIPPHTWSAFVSVLRPEWTGGREGDILFKAATTTVGRGAGEHNAAVRRLNDDHHELASPSRVRGDHHRDRAPTNVEMASVSASSFSSPVRPRVATAAVRGMMLEAHTSSPIPSPLEIVEGDEAEGDDDNAAAPFGMTFPQFEQIVRFTQKSFQFDDVTAADAVLPSAAAGVNITVHPVAPAPARGDVSAAAAALRVSEAPPLHTLFPSQPWKGLHWYFTYRIALPPALLDLIGRNEKFIESEESQADPMVYGPNVPWRTPLHPSMTLRHELTTLSLCELVSDLLTALHILFVVLSMILEHEGDSVESVRACNNVAVFLEVIFLLEVASKMALARGAFFRSKLQMLDAVFVFVIWIAQIFLFAHSTESVQDPVSFMRLIRAFRLYHRLNSFTLLLQVLSQVGPPLAALLGVLFILLYTYSMIGMMFFVNTLDSGKVSISSDYHSGDYYTMNFNDLARSLIALFYLLVMNDWAVLMGAVAETSGQASRIFFISFWCISVIIVSSVCTAFVVEAYMDMHEQKLLQSLKSKRGAPIVPPEALPMPQPVSLAPGLAAEVNAGGPVQTKLRAYTKEQQDARPSVSRRQTAHNRVAFGHPLDDQAAVSSSSSIGRPSLVIGTPQDRPGGFFDATVADEEAANAAANESELLGRIRQRATSSGLRVRVQKPAGAVSTAIKNAFAAAPTSSSLPKPAEAEDADED